jgi:hypothetical protein
MKDISSSSQGAPVAITKVEIRAMPSSQSDKVRMQFTIHAQNKAKGIIMDRGRYKEICLGEELQSEDYNRISLKSLRFSDYEYAKGAPSDMECSPEPMRKIRDGYYTVCELRDENAIPKSKAAFQTPIVIELEYGYKIALSQRIDILNKQQQIR